MADPISLEVSDGVAFATIDAPPMNLLGNDLLGAIAALAAEVGASDTVRVLVLQSANPDFFIAHFDVEAIL